MDENKEVVTEEVLDDNTEKEEVDDSADFVKAKTFPIDESWPEELKKQVEQLNQMSEMLNADLETDDDDELDSDDDSETEDTQEEEKETPAVETEETETYENVF